MTRRPLLDRLGFDEHGVNHRKDAVGRVAESAKARCESAWRKAGRMPFCDDPDCECECHACNGGFVRGEGRRLCEECSNDVEGASDAIFVEGKDYDKLGILCRRCGDKRETVFADGRDYFGDAQPAGVRFARGKARA